MKRIFLIAFILFQLGSLSAFSQCAMCARVAETSNNPDTNSRKGLNKGIIYLLSIPYILGGIGVFVWYKNKSKG